VSLNICNKEKGKGKRVGNLKIVRKRVIKGKVDEEQIIEINLPLDEKTIRDLEKKVR
jgi:hypothetical protein